MESLEDVAVAVDAVAAEQRTVARAARRMQRARARGEAWSTILDRDESAALVDLVRRSPRRLRDASSTLTSLLAAGLADEGESRRRMARRLGVSHPRITSILRSLGGATAVGE